MKDFKVFKIRIRNYEDYLQLLQGVFNLSPKESEVLVKCLKCMTRLNEKCITTEVRRQLASDLNISNINVYIKSLKDKSVILKANNELVINELLLLSSSHKGIIFVWEIEE